MYCDLHNDGAIGTGDKVGPYEIGLPGEDGYGLIRRVRVREERRGGRLPAVALTAYARAEDRKLALLAGFQMHVAKPIQPADLVAVVAGLAARTA
jgi:CheY-like chemotaxis protein